MFSIHARMVFTVIIFDSVWFLPIKTTKLKFYKIYKKPKPNQTGFDSVWLFYIKN
jgi:hypothetical protein